MSAVTATGFVGGAESLVEHRLGTSPRWLPLLWDRVRGGGVESIKRSLPKIRNF